MKKLNKDQRLQERIKDLAMVINVAQCARDQATDLNTYETAKDLCFKYINELHTLAVKHGITIDIKSIILG